LSALLSLKWNAEYNKKTACGNNNLGCPGNSKKSPIDAKFHGFGKTASIRRFSCLADPEIRIALVMTEDFS